MTDRTNDQEAERSPPGQTDRTTGPAIGAAWLTYAQIGERFSMSPEAARQRARRLRWRTQPGNDGRTLVLVPDSTAVQPRGRPPDRTTDQPTVQTPGQPSVFARLSGLLERANERADKAEARAEQERQGRERAEARADTADTDRRAAQARADQAEAGRDNERARADDLRDRLIAMQEQLADAHAALQAAEEAKARAGRAEQGRDQERGRADKAEAAIAAERARAGALRERIEALQEQLAVHQGGVDATETIRQAEAMVDNLREAHSDEVSALKAERHRLATQIDGFAARADQAEAHTDSLRARVDVLQRERDTARAEAEEAAAELRRAEADRKARGLLARLRAAVRGQ